MSSLPIAIPQSIWKSLHLLAKAGIGTQEGYPIQFEIAHSHTPLNLIRGGNALGTGFFDALITGRGLLSNLETLEASANIQTLALKLLDQEVHNSQPIEIRYASQRLNILNLALESADSRFQISGSLPLRADVPSGDVTLSAHLNLDTIGNLLPTANSLNAKGIVELNGKIKGSLARLEPSGLLSLRHGQLKIKGRPSPLENLSAELEMESGLMSVKSLSGTLGHGSIQASGSWPLKALLRGSTFGSESLTPSTQFSIQAEKIPWSSVLAMPENTSGYFSVNLRGKQPNLVLRPSMSALSSERSWSSKRNMS
jgi:hypothetical protein